MRTRLHAIFRRSYRTYFGFDRDYDGTFSVYAVLGCCLLLSRTCAEAVTPFDEYPFLYEEELMLGIRMEERGFRTVYHGAAVIEYLGMRKWQILPLYWYRVALYLARCARYGEFRDFWGEFRAMTGEELRRC